MFDGLLHHLVYVLTSWDHDATERLSKSTLLFSSFEQDVLKRKWPLILECHHKVAAVIQWDWKSDRKSQKLTSLEMYWWTHGSNTCCDFCRSAAWEQQVGRKNCQKLKRWTCERLEKVKFSWTQSVKIMVHLDSSGNLTQKPLTLTFCELEIVYCVWQE